MAQRYSFAILVALLFFAILSEPIAASRVGGVRVIVAAYTLCLFLANYMRGDVPFWIAVRQMVKINHMMIFLLAWYYLGAVLGVLRGGMIVLVEWKFHASAILGLGCGFFLARNAKYRRIAIYMVMFLMLFHAVFSNQYVTATGQDLRSALADVEGALGHTDYWTKFGMLLLLCVGYLLEEKNRLIKIVGLVVAAYLYKTLFFCGFATPVALFLIAHMLLGLACIRWGKKGIVQVVVRGLLGGVLLFAAVNVAYRVARAEGDERFVNIQVRFANFFADPEGGGYQSDKSRFEIAHISIDTIKRHPLFGCGGSYMMNTQTGGHHAFFDFLALYGLIGGGGAFVWFVFHCMANAYHRCRQERNWIAFTTFAGVGMFVIVGFVNPGWMGGALTTLFFFLHPYRMPKPMPRQTLLTPFGLPGPSAQDEYPQLPDQH